MTSMTTPPPMLTVIVPAFRCADMLHHWVDRIEDIELGCCGLLLAPCFEHQQQENAVHDALGYRERHTKVRF